MTFSGGCTERTHISSLLLMVPQWLHFLSIGALLLGAVCALWIAVDEMHRPQQMWIMNVVWPVVALFGTLLVVWVYLRYGRLATYEKRTWRGAVGEEAPSEGRTPFPVKVIKGTLHCGSGCALGDIVSEWLIFAVPTILAGVQSLLGTKVIAVWVFDYLAAFAFGILFQYFTIKPMRDLSIGQGLLQALKADTLSLTAWQLGMYGFMAVAQFVLFKRLLATTLEVDTVEFWFMMQLAMLAGFVTSYPMNWWLLRTGIKEAM